MTPQDQFNIGMLAAYFSVQQIANEIRNEPPENRLFILQTRLEGFIRRVREDLEKS